MVDSAGGCTQLSLIVTSVIVLIVLLFLAGPLACMPEVVLSATVFVGVEQGMVLATVLSLIDHSQRGYRPQRVAGWHSR